ncbi:MAG: lipid-binding SYLF domain-containing protein [Candidatus Aminicenantes bacterium]|nr:lipid-binding SYLF domain-containing protein [Candidatus Aminicenantes bacterium]
MTQFPKKIHIVSCVILFMLVFSTSPTGLDCYQKSKEVERVENSILVFKELVDLPEEGIPGALLSRAEAIAVIPGFWNAAWGIGGRHGKGVIMVRKGKKDWSYPSFISMTGGSIGFQIGIQKADIILVFKDKRSVKTISEGKFTLGVGASVVAGPIGRKTEADTDIKFEAEIYSYSKSKGLFAGISVEGASLTMDTDANAKFYRNFDLAVDEILSKDEIESPAVAKELMKIVTHFAR